MLLALQRRLLGSSSTTLILHRIAHSDCAAFHPQYFRSPAAQGQLRRLTAKVDDSEPLFSTESRDFRIRKVSAESKDDAHGGGAVEGSWRNTPQAHTHLPDGQEHDVIEAPGLSHSVVRPRIRQVSASQHDAHGINLTSGIQPGPPSTAARFREGWRRHLVTFEQYEYQSNFEARVVRGLRLVDSPWYAQDWELWLELIVFRRRHHGAKGTIAIYKEIFQRELRLPTEGIVGDQLWDLLLQTGHHDPALLEEILVYAIHLKSSTRRSWSKLYYGIMSIAMKEEPDSVFDWHVRVRDDFPPSLEDYQKIFRLSIDRGRSAYFRGLYLDAPLIGMYNTVVCQLCDLQMYTEALRWHDLLCQAGDFPTKFTDIEPLLDHLVYVGLTSRLEIIVGQLAEAKLEIGNVGEEYAKRDTVITREIMNRQLGEVHGIAPKSLSDSFCARLFATQFFSVDTVIKGLHMIATEVIGPLSLREIAVRDNCDPAAICHHIDILRHAGISLDNSVFCTIVQSLAVQKKSQILESVVNCDLHPDTFADDGLQERLLAQYHEGNDLVKIERTLTILTVGCREENLQGVLMNLNLRSQITLGRREKVLAIIEEMKHMGIAVSGRSSRHLRVCWLSRRQVGRSAERTQELAILIQASQMTMQSGRFIPIIAWREILRRLGMAGRLREVENLALWLVDWYSSPAAKAAYLKHISYLTSRRQGLIESHVASKESLNLNPRHHLNLLFTTSAQHAIVSWGFQQTMDTSMSIRRFTQSRTVGDSPHLGWTPRFDWTWGLHLLYKLRERGVPIHKGEVGRICRHRLDTLFGTGFSKRRINRRAVAENSYSESLYVQKMEDIWGKDLFRVWVPVRKDLRKGRSGWRRQ